MNELYKKIQQLIKRGKFGPNDPLPDITQLQKRLKAEKSELEIAIADLIYEGVIERTPSAREILRIPA